MLINTLAHESSSVLAGDTLTPLAQFHLSIGQPHDYGHDHPLATANFRTNKDDIQTTVTVLTSMISTDLWAGGMHDRGLLQLQDNHVLQEAQVSLQLQAATLLLSHSHRLCTYGQISSCKPLTDVSGGNHA